MELGAGLGVLEFLLEETITCYEGKKHEGCGVCPACKLRNAGLKEFLKTHPLNFSWKAKL
jgi:7-cyano-7-deazaguanine synthase